jgi:hypothetical protein
MMPRRLVPALLAALLAAAPLDRVGRTYTDRLALMR